MGHHLCVYLLKDKEYELPVSILKKGVVYDSYEINEGQLNGAIMIRGENDPRTPKWVPLLEGAKAFHFWMD